MESTADNHVGPPIGMNLVLWATSGVVVGVGSVLTVFAEVAGSGDNSGFVWLTVGGLGVIVGVLKLMAEAIKALSPVVADARKQWRAAAQGDAQAELEELKEELRRSEEGCKETTDYLREKVHSNEERIERLEKELVNINDFRNQEYKRYESELKLQRAENDRIIALYQAPIRQRIENSQQDGPEKHG